MHEHLVHEWAIALRQAIDISTWKNYRSALNSYLSFVHMHDMPVNPTAKMLSFYTVYMCYHIKPDSVNTYFSDMPPAWILLSRYPADWESLPGALHFGWLQTFMGYSHNVKTSSHNHWPQHGMWHIFTQLHTQWSAFLYSTVCWLLCPHGVSWPGWMTWSSAIHENWQSVTLW